MRRFGIIAILAIAIGCAPKQEEPKEPATQATAGQPQTQAQAPNNQGGVTPLMPGATAGPMTPVAGAENVQGSGGGSVGMAAKDMAKRSAASQQNQQNQPLPTEDTE